MSRGFFDVRMRGFGQRIPVADFLRRIDERVQPLPAERIFSLQAAGRVLAEDVRAEVAVPGFDRAAMDGYALRASETQGAAADHPIRLQVIGESMPARPFPGRVESGQAVRIMTGAPMPEGADAVLPVEQAQEEEGALTVRESLTPGRHVGRRGEDVEPGRVVLTAGRRLRPQDLGLLASLGVSEVAVVRRPRVEVLITGDELLPAGARPYEHRIVDSSSVMLAALIQRDGGSAETGPILPDVRTQIRTALATSRADVLLLSGGSSVGQEDHGPSLVSELGELLVHGVSLRPAAPTGMGLLAGRPVFLLPGNPVACLCAYDLFAGRAIRRLGGRSNALPHRFLSLPLAGDIPSVSGRVDYVRVCIRAGKVEPLAAKGASLLTTTTLADGFVLVPHERAGLAADEEVTVFLYDEEAAAP